jgi:hypothetical protein
MDGAHVSIYTHHLGDQVFVHSLRCFGVLPEGREHARLFLNGAGGF